MTELVSTLELAGLVIATMFVLAGTHVGLLALLSGSARHRRHSTDPHRIELPDGAT